MKKLHRGYYCIARTIAIAAILLFVPFVASASGNHTPAPAQHGIGGDHDQRLSVLVDSLEHAPADKPLHCHLTSSHPLEVGPSPTPIDGDPPLLMAREISVTTPETEPRWLAPWARVPIPALPRFILFGNFRS